MNNANKYETDDELLSAYLDDELSSDERALVESRLATDPAARHTLDQLRGVSQSVRDLPTECARHDQLDEIMQRVARTDSTGASTVPQLPTISIGRTTRGWVWAFAAIAAAVLIMVLQPGNEQNADLPNVAQRGQSRAKSSLPVNRKLAENQAAGRTTVGRAGGAPMAAAEPTTTSRELSADSFAHQTPSEASGQVAASAPAAQPSAMATEESRAAAPPPVVVRVLARRAAVENNAFETLLADHGVQVEPTARQLDGRGSAATRDYESAASELKTPAPNATAKDESMEIGNLKQGNDNIEVVLVDAPESTILSCLNALNSDADNYLGIAVADTATPTDKAPAIAKTAENKHLAELGKFNRGVVPPLSGTPLGVDINYNNSEGDDAQIPTQQLYFDAADRFRGGQDNDRIVNQESPALGEERAANLGRARRLPARVAEELEHVASSSNAAAFGGKLAADAKFKLRSLEQRSLPSAPDGDRMQVLFVIRPIDEPAPSLKAKNQPQ